MIVRLIICAIYLSFSNHSTYARFEEKIRSRKGEDKHFMYKKYPHIYMYIMCVHVHARACARVCVYICTHICIHAYICTERACTDTHTHTHTEADTPIPIFILSSTGSSKKDNLRLVFCFNQFEAASEHRCFLAIAWKEQCNY